MVITVGLCIDKASIDGAKKCSGPVSARAIRPVNKTVDVRAPRIKLRLHQSNPLCIITFSAQRQHRKSVSCSSRAVCRSLAVAWKNYRTVFSHRPCIQTNGRTDEMTGPNGQRSLWLAKMPRDCQSG